ncbi:MAG: hypothetical protein KGI67_06555 [Pseudomonadota bacterium]|nr:hypothetical protein [Pseudomonadota bacterium]
MMGIASIRSHGWIADGGRLARAVVGLLALTGCASLEPTGHTAPAPVDGLAGLRPPALGQQWVYQVRDLYTGRIIDHLTETVEAVEPEVRITRQSERHGVLPPEIQRPWGHFVQDAQWDRPAAFSAPAPAWPERMGTTRWSGEYQIGGASDFRYRWAQTMQTAQWESTPVAAGTFVALHYRVNIHYAGPEDYYYVDSEREASVWLAPEVGRWVLRRARGVRYAPGHGSADQDDALQWELLSWR